MSGIALLSPRTHCTLQLGCEGLPSAACIGAVAEVASLLAELCACWGRTRVQICVFCYKKKQAHFRCRLNLQDSSWRDYHGTSECHVHVFSMVIHR